MMCTTCKYCNEPEDKQDSPGLICESCMCFVHLECLRRPGTPGDFACDVFFDFTCEDCSEDKKEVFTRNKFPWVNVVLLTLHHLNTQSQGISNNTYFHYKTHICSFIDRSWTLLFGPHIKQKKNWIGTIAGVLSLYSNFVFKSGSMVLGETGWWKLLHGFSPAVAADIIQEMAREKPKGRPRHQFAFDKLVFTQKVTEMGYQHLINLEDENASMVSEEAAPAKKMRLDSDGTSTIITFFDETDSDVRQELEEGAEEAEAVFRGFGLGDPLPSQLYSLKSHPVPYYDSDSRDGCSGPPAENPDGKPAEKPKKHQGEKPYTKRESLFSTELNSVDLPWVEEEPEINKDLVEMSQYEEIQLLKQVEGLVAKVKDPNKKAYLCRLRASLALRRLKRHRHLPLFDLDKTVRLLGGYMPDEQRIVANGERVLDRFQRSYLVDSLCGTVARGGAGALVAGRCAEAAFRSPLSGALLKPYIRRDAAAKPLWLRLTDELLIRTHRHIEDYEPPAHATLDFSYVRPQHIAAVNNLCAQFFWPGIDLTEALQYPEHSCVVTYKRVVVACAFLVPDAAAGDAYISFVLTRPEWRGAGIGSFMLYHLLQTCSGKDVTLHVSPTNPAIFLYQKFGFKVEELVQDFYEKYYDIDYKGCRHALFLRLIR